MSAYVVGKQTIDRIVTALQKDSLDYALPDLREKDPNKLGQKLWNMNVQAFSERYGENINVPEYEWSREYINDIQLIKTLHCFLYQCSEGSVPETPLYQQVKKYIYHLMEKYIMRLPEYSKADWD